MNQDLLNNIVAVLERYNVSCCLKFRKNRLKKIKVANIEHHYGRQLFLVLFQCRALIQSLQKLAISWVLYLILLTHLFPIHPFSTLWKTSKNRKVFWCFQRVEKWCIGIKWVDGEIKYSIAEVKRRKVSREERKKLKQRLRDSNFAPSKIFRDNLVTVSSSEYASGKCGPSTQVIGNMKNKIITVLSIGEHL